jgi:hypothetical protein
MGLRDGRDDRGPMMKPTWLLLLAPLACASFGFAQQAPQHPAAANGWQQSQKTDTARAFNYTRFTLVGKFVKPPQVKSPQAVSDMPALTVDCIPGEESHSAKGRLLAANLLVGSTLKVVYVEPEEIRGTSYFPKVTVRYRTDGAEEEEKWSPSTEKTSASIPKDALKKFLRARTVAITADADGGSPIALQFDMPDATPVEAACNVD